MKYALSGDIGGTKTLLELSHIDNGEVVKRVSHRYVSAEFTDFSLLIKDFLSRFPVDNSNCIAMCLGVAGPVDNWADYQIADITNLPWCLNSQSLVDEFQLGSVSIINDFQAVGYGINVLNDSEFVSLQQGSVIPKGNRLVIGAGTGLGVGLMIDCGGSYKVLATEGGHIDYCPRSDIEFAFAQFLIERYGRSCWEFVVSGPGLVNLYQFLHQHRGGNAGCLAEVMSAADPSAIISERAINESDELAIEALKMFVSNYGAVAGNFALSSLPKGGVFIAGGIAPKILPYLKGPAFTQAFNSKGKMQSLCESFSISVVMNTEVGLIGPRAFAEKQAKLL